MNGPWTKERPPWLGAHWRPFEFDKGGAGGRKILVDFVFTLIHKCRLFRIDHGDDCRVFTIDHSTYVSEFPSSVVRYRPNQRQCGPMSAKPPIATCQRRVLIDVTSDQNRSLLDRALRLTKDRIGRPKTHCEMFLAWPEKSL
jgi:hypothetical protein